MDNKALFDELRTFDLPPEQYVVTASGPLGIRNLREINDIDIKVTDELWETLKKKFGTHLDEGGILKIKLSNNIEATCQKSFEGKNVDAPTINKQIEDAEFIDGFPCENIQTLLYFKKLGTRDKDKKDVVLIERWLRENF